ncbi:exported protein of unknown function [Georgfuchsia toluolica]|uniref:Lipoprotein n=1 Tax=Georgfuchsia toluolica TaxID=424218 RepID=A0A916J8Q6_9PROT|nr:hypothetical protein [Georgfuchsia toluolica]CAG4885242.1 exported protein of unknown function [Georgfuchsia toluolica]
MKKVFFILLVVAISFSAACSKSSPETKSATTETGATQVDYKKICEHLIQISPEKTDGLACEAKYRGFLPSCQNAEAVTDCYLKIKTWDERLACFDSCVREAKPAK